MKIKKALLRSNIDKMINVIEKSAGNPCPKCGTNMSITSDKPKGQIVNLCPKCKQVYNSDGKLIQKAKYEGEEKSELQSAKASQDRPKTRTISKAGEFKPRKFPGTCNYCGKQHSGSCADYEKKLKAMGLKKSVDSLIKKIEKESRTGIKPRVKPGYEPSKIIREEKKKYPIPHESQESGDKLAKEMIKCNPAKERAAMRVRKAVLLVEKQTGKNWEPMSNFDVCKSLGLSKEYSIDEVNKELSRRGLV